MMHPDTELRFIDERIGYGVFATRPIPRGTVIWILCAFDHIYRREEVAGMPEAYQEIVARYSYIDGEGRFVLCWDQGRYVNHSCNPAMLGVGPSFEIAVRDIAAGEQITCEYGGLNMTAPLRCLCGSSNCRGWVRADDALRYASTWDAQVQESLPLAARVRQPLLPFMTNPREYHDLLAGRMAIPSHSEYFCETPDNAADSAEGSLPWALHASRG